MVLMVVLLVVVLLVVVLLLLHHPLRGRLVLKSLCLRRISPARRLGLPAAATAAVIAARATVHIGARVQDCHRPVFWGV